MLTMVVSPRFYEQVERDARDNGFDDIYDYLLRKHGRGIKLVKGS